MNIKRLIPNPKPLSISLEKAKSGANIKPMLEPNIINGIKVKIAKIIFQLGNTPKTIRKIILNAKFVIKEKNRIGKIHQCNFC